eukprot:09621.XXX_359920_361432_1 [CDS] Oithona nana genome sequencing.
MTDASPPQQSPPGMNESPFENIDINPEFRIPSPQPPLWLRFWQPIGNTVMDTRVLKEPRGFMRCIEWLFAIIAFSLCCDFATYVEYTVDCKGAGSTHYKHSLSYPFKLDHEPAINASCGVNQKFQMYLPGDFSSDAQFFVFVGVISFLGTMVSLAVYVFFSDLYMSEQKKAPMVDFCLTAILAIFWLAASAAWANGVINMKYAANPDNWIFDSSDSICQRDNGNYINTNVDKCNVVERGSFQKANISIIIGFLNTFLWSANLWFLYKETSWFSNGSQQQQQQTQQPA